MKHRNFLSLYFHSIILTIWFASNTLFGIQTPDSSQAPQESKKEQRIPKKFNRTTKFRYQKEFKPKQVEPKPEKKIISQPQPNNLDQIIKKNIRDMNAEELAIAKDYAYQTNDKDRALKCAERLVLLIPNDDEQLRALRLEIPDLYFDSGDMKKAGKEYRKYREFYPGGKDKKAIEQRDYAHYKEVLCRFYARLKPPLDQSKTRKTIMVANSYLDRTDTFKHFADEVIKIKKDCYSDLYEYELDIVHQYLNLDKLVAAKTRIDSIKEEFLPIMAEIEPKLLELEGLVAQRQGKEAIVAQKLEELSKKFPAYQPTMIVTQSKQKKDYVKLF